MAQTTSARPRKEDYGWNGRPCYAGDGVGDRFQSTGTSIAANFSGVNQPWAMWMPYQAFVPSLTLILQSFGANATTPFMEWLLTTANAYLLRKNVGANVDVTGGTSDLLRHMVYVECQGATASFEIDGVPVASGAFSNASMTFTRDAIMCLWRSTITNMAPMRFPMQVVLVGVPTAPQKAGMDAYAMQWLTPQTAPMLAMMGDSHTNVDLGETTWLTLARAAFPGSVIIDNGVVGDTLVNVLSKDAAQGIVYRYQDSNFDAARVVNAYGNHYGANDIEGASSRTDVQLLADHLTCNNDIDVRHSGTPRIACTLHQISGLPAGKETIRQNYNTELRANFAAYGFTHLLDKDLIIPELPSDMSVFDPDGKHLNATGEGYLFSGRFGIDGMQQILTSLGFV
ncbi:MAG TPA: hypothetical protein VJN18_35885 [Polyangiaceae bacterium]|nr:hypothetical protein [Polyangiaceae bacterium]